MFARAVEAMTQVTGARVSWPGYQVMGQRKAFRGKRFRGQDQGQFRFDQEVVNVSVCTRIDSFIVP